MIQINQPLVIAQTQDLFITKTEVKHEEGVIDVSYVIKNELGDVVDGKTIRFAGQEAQDFWSAFISKTALYELLVTKIGLNVTVPELPDVI